MTATSYRSATGTFIALSDLYPPQHPGDPDKIAKYAALMRSGAILNGRSNAFTLMPERGLGSPTT